MIRVHIPYWTELPEEARHSRAHLVQDVSEWIHRETVFSQIKANDGQLSFLEVWYDEILVGTAALGSRRGHQHILKHGAVQVLPQYRRLRCGTAMYASQVLCGLMEGNRLAEDCIIWDYSPWMVEGFLPSMGYRLQGIFPRQTRGHHDNHYLYQPLFDLVNWLKKVPVGSTLMWIESPTTQRRLEKNLKNCYSHSPTEARLLEMFITTLRDSAVTVDENRRTLTITDQHQSLKGLAPAFGDWDQLPIVETRGRCLEISRLEGQR